MRVRRNFWWLVCYLARKMVWVLDDVYFYALHRLLQPVKRKGGCIKPDPELLCEATLLTPVGLRGRETLSQIGVGVVLMSKRIGGEL